MRLHHDPIPPCTVANGHKWLEFDRGQLFRGEGGFFAALLSFAGMTVRARCLNCHARRLSRRTPF